MSRERRANHLAGSTSPYLLQHVHNPVDWYPWDEEALARARDLDRPIFLSIGYAACHWCHVMERESFEDEAIAARLNAGFVPIKVDREERPDLDDVYMNAVQLFTGQGGWPMSVFLTPDLRPFAGGTYFPPESMLGRIGFGELLDRVLEAWKTRREEVRHVAESMTDRLREIAEGFLDPGDTRSLGDAERRRALEQWRRTFDERHGGFGGAPKFPPDGALTYLLAEGDDDAAMALRTLDAMLHGGLFDHVGGGFCRYSVDERWLVPHFEKMLYNQALLVPAYLAAWQRTRRARYRDAVRRTLDFVRRELTAPDGGFLSSLDADSEGEEGRFYVWTPDEVAGVLGESDGEAFCARYDITTAGNFEGRSIPNLLAHDPASIEPEAFAAARERLLEARADRVRPATDDKVLTAWNGLMIAAFARAYRTLGDPRDLAAAEAAADFVVDTLVDGERLRVSHRDGRSTGEGFLDDHAFLGLGMLELYEAGFDPRRLELAIGCAERILAAFRDSDGGFRFVAGRPPDLLARNRSLHDGALPSGAGVALELLLRGSHHADRPEWRRRVAESLRAYRTAVARAPSAFASLLRVARMAAAPLTEVAVVGPLDDPRTRALLAVLPADAEGRIVRAAGAPGAGGSVLLAGLGGEGDPPTARVCRDGACTPPVTDPERLRARLGEAEPSGPGRERDAGGSGT